LSPGYTAVAASTGAHLLWRAKIGLQLERIETLTDGSWLARWQPSKRHSKEPLAGTEHQIVRVIEYKLGKSDGGGAAGNAEVYRLLTTILDPQMALAEELAELYPQRWEIELTIKESKSILRKGQVTLRSKAEELVEQEFWGLLLAHYMVRKMMAQAAQTQGLDPDELSYQSSVEIIKSTQAGPASSVPKKVRKAVFGGMLNDIAKSKVVSSRGKSKERTIKRKPRSKFPVRKRGAKPTAQGIAHKIHVVR
jgi:Transposase DDE domain